ncbi:unnamed protein product [Sympodiomycopsis kandeliae]
MTKITIVHDVLGTLFGFSSPISVLQSLFTTQVQDDRFAELIIMDWYHSAQRDFTNLSINGNYTPIAQVFKRTLPRVLLQAGLLPPDQQDVTIEEVRASAADKNPYPQDGKVVTSLMDSLKSLSPRPGMQQAFLHTYKDTTLYPTSDTQVNLWGATNGGIPLATLLFQNALQTQDLSPLVNIWSCDSIKVAKPHPDVYKAVKREIHADDSGTSIWFVASHSWDTDAASRAGFKTCWIRYEEFHPATGDDAGGYRRPDLQAKDVDDAARKIFEWERRHSSQ